MQYTIRNVPESLDAEIRRRAEEERTTLNEAALRALAKGVGLSGTRMRFRDLKDLSGTWKEDPDFDQAIADQHSIEPELWK